MCFSEVFSRFLFYPSATVVATVKQVWVHVWSCSLPGRGGGVLVDPAAVSVSPGVCPHMLLPAGSGLEG